MGKFIRGIIERLKVEQDCSTCNGTGEVYNGSEWVTCGSCGGSGTITVEV